MTETEIEFVKPAWWMTDEMFAKHMTYRHIDSLAGLEFLDPDLDAYLMELYRTFHDRLHAIRIDLTHEHLEE